MNKNFKTLLKCAIAILAIPALFSSCVKEVLSTENEALLEGETVTFYVESPETKTALGPISNNVYPNYWAAGDRISVNGVASNTLTEADAGKVKAGFSVSGVTSPYRIAYPSSAVSNYSAGKAIITLPTAQKWVDGSYDSSSFVMYSKTDQSIVTLGCAMAVLRFTPTTGKFGNIKSMTITALGSKKIAGSFGTDFINMTPNASATQTITVTASQAEGVALGKPWFVCIPTGDYSDEGFEVTFETVSGSKMTKTAKFTKTFAAGNVYSFSLPFVPNYIKGASDLTKFCNAGTGRLNYKNLTFDGNNESITDNAMSKIPTVVNEVSGELVFKNIKTWTMVEQVFNWTGVGGQINTNTVVPKGSIRFINCPNLNNFGGLRAFSKINGDLEVDGSKPYWNWGSFQYITEITGNLIVKNITPVASGGTSMNCGYFSSLKKVGGDLHYENCSGCQFWQFCDIDIQEIGGCLRLINNAEFNNFSAGTGSTHSGLKGLTKIGSIYMTKNGSIGDTGNGWNIIQGFIDNSVVPYHKVECYKTDGTTRVAFTFGGENVELTGAAQIKSFGTSGIGRKNFKRVIVDGNNETVSDSEMNTLRNVINEVSEEFTFKNIKGWSSVEQVINWNGTVGTWSATSVIPKGNLRFINCPNLSNFGGIRAMTVLPGDFEIDACPVRWGWGSFSQITECKGNIIIKNAIPKATSGSGMNFGFFAGLKKVAGDFHFENCNNCEFWQFCDIDLEQIGGSLTVVNCSGFGNFGAGTGSTHTGVTALTKCGSVYVAKCGDIKAISAGTGTGWDAIQGFINRGLMPTKNAVCYDKNGNRITFSAGADYYFSNGSISYQVLTNYLSKAVTHAELLNSSSVTTDGYYGTEDDFRMLGNIGAKFIGRSMYMWGRENNWNNATWFSTAKTKADRIHAMDPDIILQAAIFEIVTTNINNVPIPSWVFTAFGKTPVTRNFSYSSMINTSSKYVDWWGKGSSVPDMSKEETQMWFYYAGCRYMEEVGIEALHLGQITLMCSMGDQANGYAGLIKLTDALRAAAKTKARRGTVLLDYHGKGIDKNGKHIFDYVSYPLCLTEVSGSTTMEVYLNKNKTGSIICKTGSSTTCTTPSGWTTKRLPYLLEFDNFGVSDSPGQPGVTGFTWGYDEISWFSNVTEEYQKTSINNFITYLNAQDASYGHLQMPCCRLAVGASPITNNPYRANTKSSESPYGRNLEETIKTIFATK